MLHLFLRHGQQVELAAFQDIRNPGCADAGAVDDGVHLSSFQAGGGLHAVAAVFVLHIVPVEADTFNHLAAAYFHAVTCGDEFDAFALQILQALDAGIRTDEDMRGVPL